MIKLLNRAVILLAVCAVVGVNALAETITKKVTFARDVTVAGTPVKAGTYKAVYDEETRELSLIKGGKTVAKAPARIEKYKNLAEGSYAYRTEDNALLRVGLKDGNLAVIENGVESAGGRSQ